MRPAEGTRAEAPGIDWTGALIAGLLGGAAVTAVTLALWALGIPALSVELVLGSSVTRTTGFGAWVLGCGIHLLFAAGIGVLYAAILEAIGRGGWRPALGIACVHAFLAGWILPLVEAAHPLVRAGVLPGPGAFDSEAGAPGVASFVLAHLAYGAVVGASYAPRSPLCAKPAADGESA